MRLSSCLASVGWEAGLDVAAAGAMVSVVLVLMVAGLGCRVVNVGALWLLLCWRGGFVGRLWQMGTGFAAGAVAFLFSRGNKYFCRAAPAFVLALPRKVLLPKLLFPRTREFMLARGAALDCRLRGNGGNQVHFLSGIGCAGQGRQAGRGCLVACLPELGE